VNSTTTYGGVQTAGGEAAGEPGAKLKLAIYMHDLSGSGVERMRLGMLPVLASSGVAVQLLLHSKQGDLLPQLPPDTRVRGFETARTLFDVVPLWRYLRRERPDVLLVSLDHNNVIALIAKAFAQTPTRVVICQHNALSAEASHNNNWKYRVVPFLYRRLAGLAHGIVAVSQGVADDLVATCGIPRERITVI